MLGVLGTHEVSVAQSQALVHSWGANGRSEATGVRQRLIFALLAKKGARVCSLTSMGFSENLLIAKMNGWFCF